MKKKFLAAFLAAAMGMTLVVGCGSGGSGKGESTEAKGEGTDGEKVTITWYSADNGSGAQQALVDAFNASQDEIEVEWIEGSTKSDDFKKQLTTSLSAGSSEYDVILMDCCWVSDLASSGYLEPMDEYMMDSGLSTADFNPGAIQASTYSAKLYAVPFYVDTASLCVRNDIVSPEDLEVLVSGDYTYRDLMDMAAKYAGQGGTKYGLAVQANQYEGLVCNTNEWTSNFTNVKEGLENFKEAVKADYTSDKQLSMIESDGVDLMTSGQCVMYRGWSSTYSNFTDETEVGPEQITPACLPNSGGSTLGGWEMGININSEKKEAAWEFVKYATSGEGNMVFCKTGNNIPGYTPNAESEELAESNEIVASEGMQNSLKITISRPNVERYNELSDRLQVAIHTYLSDEAEIDETVTEVQSLLDEYGFQPE